MPHRYELFLRFFALPSPSPAMWFRGTRSRGATFRHFTAVITFTAQARKVVFNAKRGERGSARVEEPSIRIAFPLQGAGQRAEHVLECFALLQTGIESRHIAEPFGKQ